MTMLTQAQLASAYDAAPKELDHDDKVQHVAGLWLVDPVDVEGAIASRESAHSAAMGEGAL